MTAVVFFLGAAGSVSCSEALPRRLPATTSRAAAVVLASHTSAATTTTSASQGQPSHYSWNTHDVLKIHIVLQQPQTIIDAGSFVVDSATATGAPTQLLCDLSALVLTVEEWMSSMASSTTKRQDEKTVLHRQVLEGVRTRSPPSGGQNSPGKNDTSSDAANTATTITLLVPHASDAASKGPLPSRDARTFVVTLWKQNNENNNTMVTRRLATTTPHRATTITEVTLEYPQEDCRFDEGNEDTTQGKSGNVTSMIVVLLGLWVWKWWGIKEAPRNHVAPGSPLLQQDGLLYQGSCSSASRNEPEDPASQRDDEEDVEDASQTSSSNSSHVPLQDIIRDTVAHLLLQQQQNQQQNMTTVDVGRQQPQPGVLPIVHQWQRKEQQQVLPQPPQPPAISRLATIDDSSLPLAENSSFPTFMMAANQQWSQGMAQARHLSNDSELPDSIRNLLAAAGESDDDGDEGDHEVGPPKQLPPAPQRPLNGFDEEGTIAPGMEEKQVDGKTSHPVVAGGIGEEKKAQTVAPSTACRPPKATQPQKATGNAVDPTTTTNPSTCNPSPQEEEESSGSPDTTSWVEQENQLPEAHLQRGHEILTQYSVPSQSLQEGPSGKATSNEAPNKEEQPTGNNKVAFRTPPQRYLAATEHVRVNGVRVVTGGSEPNQRTAPSDHSPPNYGSCEDDASKAASSESTFGGCTTGRQPPSRQSLPSLATQPPMEDERMGESSHTAMALAATEGSKTESAVLPSPHSFAKVAQVPLTAPGVETDEGPKPAADDDDESSYVSTLPPDSDYVSDDVVGVNKRKASSSGETPRSSADTIFTPPPMCTLLHRQGDQTCLKPQQPSLNGASTQEDGTLEQKSVEELERSRHHAPVFDAPEPSSGSKFGSLHERDFDDSSSVQVVQIVQTEGRSSYKKRKARPFSASQIVPDWVPSKRLQSAAHNFMEDTMFQMATDTNDSARKVAVPKAISIRPHGYNGRNNGELAA